MASESTFHMSGGNSKVFSGLNKCIIKAAAHALSVAAKQ
jgi:hypothetical protein